LRVGLRREVHLELGTDVVNRYAELLRSESGSETPPTRAVHLDTLEGNPELNQARVAAVNSYLASTGLNLNNVKVETGLPQGRGFDAPTALRVLAEGTVDDTEGGPGAAKSGASAPSKKK
jgi:hypothetical protein